MPANRWKPDLQLIRVSPTRLRRLQSFVLRCRDTVTATGLLRLGCQGCSRDAQMGENTAKCHRSQPRNASLVESDPCTQNFDFYTSANAAQRLRTRFAQVVKGRLWGRVPDLPCRLPAVAIALGLGTMVGWKRIVVTVGEKIGKDHLTYAQGASAELVAMGTIAAAVMYGLPVSTTHILTSGVAGTMAANGSGLQWGTIKSLAMAWVLTLPAAIMLSGSLFALFIHLF
jgi:phosphate/sulfate permease